MNNLVATHEMIYKDFFVYKLDKNIDKYLNQFIDIEEYQIIIKNNKKYASFLGTVKLDGFKVENNGFIILNNMDYISLENIKLHNAIIIEKESKTITK